MTAAPASRGRVVLVTTSPRLPPGLLSWPAWQVLHTGPVLAAAGDPQVAALQAAGVEVRTPATGEDPARLLHSAARTGATATWVGTDDDLAERVAALGPPVPVEVLPGAADPPGARLLDVVAVVDRLRSPGGCPWDGAQTHASLMPYLLEEAYETYSALEDGDLPGVREELGDLLLQVVLHARLAQEDDPAWSVDDVATGLVDKLVRRHPHVFAGAPADDLEGSWEALKAEGRTSVTDGVPLGQPALSLAAKLQRRGSRLGAPVPAYAGLGGELWDLVRRCREHGLDAEVELRRVARDYRDAVAQVEAAVRDEGGDPAGLSPEQWAHRWPAAG